MKDQEQFWYEKLTEKAIVTAAWLKQRGMTRLGRGKFVRDIVLRACKRILK